MYLIVEKLFKVQHSDNDITHNNRDHVRYKTIKSKKKQP